MTSQSDQATHQKGWPSTCRFYEPSTVDAVRIAALLSEDTAYAESNGLWALQFLFVVDQQVHKYTTGEARPHFVDQMIQRSSGPTMTIIYVRQTRVFFSHRTTSSLSMDESTWKALLKNWDILPTTTDMFPFNFEWAAIGSVPHWLQARALAGQ